MALFLVTLLALAPLFMLIAIGYGLKRLLILHSAFAPVLNKIVLTVTLPALIVHSLATAPALPHFAIALPPAFIIAEGSTMALAWTIGVVMRLNAPMRGAIMVVSAFGNTGFLGYPMTLALHPTLFPEAVLLDQFGMSIALYLSVPLIGAKLGAIGKGVHSPLATALRFFHSPLFIALVIGLAARLISWPTELLHAPLIMEISLILNQCLLYLGQATTPIVLLALGLSLNPSLKAFYAPTALIASFLKLIVCPLIMWCICDLFRMPKAIISQGVLSSAMPVSVMASVLASEHDLAGEYAVNTVFISTILAALTVPTILAIVH